MEKYPDKFKETKRSRLRTERVYAGPEPDDVTELEPELEDVYNGPDPDIESVYDGPEPEPEDATPGLMRKASKAPAKTPSKPFAKIKPPIEGVYAGPEMMRMVYAGPEMMGAVYAGPEMMSGKPGGMGQAVSPAAPIEDNGLVSSIRKIFSRSNK